MDFLRFTFQSLWHFIGVMILIGTVLQGFAAIIVALAGLLHGRSE